jgi:hypothetical protein
MFQWVFLWACVVYLHAFVEFKKIRDMRKGICVVWVEFKKNVGSSLQKQMIIYCLFKKKKRWIINLNKI